MISPDENVQNYVVAYLQRLDAEATVLEQREKAGLATDKERIDFLSMSVLRLRDITVLLAGVVQELKGQDASRR